MKQPPITQVEESFETPGRGYLAMVYRISLPGVFPMHVRCLVATLSILAVTMLVPAPAAGQSRKWTPPRTPDGKPDIQGTFTFRTITPLQRPEALAGKDVLTAAEAAAFEDSENKRQHRD